MGRKTRIQIDVLALCLAQGFRCAYCPYEFVSARGPTFDHVWPRILGGTRTLRNGLAACKACNRRKDGRAPTLDELATLDRIYPLARNCFDMIRRTGGPAFVFGRRLDLLPNYVCGRAAKGVRYSPRRANKRSQNSR